jgi:hypothetical protein
LACVNRRKMDKTNIVSDILLTNVFMGMIIFVINIVIIEFTAI